MGEEEEKMKWKWLSVLCVSGLLLAGCQANDSGKDSKEKPVQEVKDNGSSKQDDKSVNQELFVPGKISKKDYKYENYVSKEKADFYRENEIYLGQELNQKEDKYLIYFFSPLCIHCDQFYSTLKQYEKYSTAYKIYKLNVDIKENVDAWKKYNLEGTPTLILYNKKEHKIENVYVGTLPLDQLPYKK